MLQVRAENSKYFVSFSGIFDDEYEVKTLMNEKKEGFVMILGDYWPESQVVEDYELVIDIFKFFYEKGDMSGYEFR